MIFVFFTLLRFSISGILGSMILHSKIISCSNNMSIISTTSICESTKGHSEFKFLPRNSLFGSDKNSNGSGNSGGSDGRRLSLEGQIPEICGGETQTAHVHREFFATYLQVNIRTCVCTNTHARTHARMREKVDFLFRSNSDDAAALM